MTQYKRPEHPTHRQLIAINNFQQRPDLPKQELPKERAKPVNWEHAEQVHVVYRWDHDLCRQYDLPTIALLAIPNSGKRSLALGQYMKAEGLRAGAPDLLLMVRRGDYAGLSIEMKRESGGIQSLEQINFERYLNSAGYKYQLCHGAEAAIACIKEYLHD